MVPGFFRIGIRVFGMKGQYSADKLRGLYKLIQGQIGVPLDPCVYQNGKRHRAITPSPAIVGWRIMDRALPPLEMDQVS